MSGHYITKSSLISILANLASDQIKGKQTNELVRIGMSRYIPQLNLYFEFFFIYIFKEVIRRFIKISLSKVIGTY